MPTRKSLAQNIRNKQRKTEYLSKKKLTNKEITEAIAGLSHNCLLLREENLETRRVFALYLEHEEKTESFNKFVKAKVEEFEKQRSENKEGT